MDKDRGKARANRSVPVAWRRDLTRDYFDFEQPVYTLWQHPQLVPLLHTQEFVLQKLRTGADLMTPGLARGPPFPPKARKNAIVAIASVENPSVPRVVGECDIDVASLERVQGAKGHAVRGHHWDGDEIWAWSHGGKSGASPPDQIEGWDVSGNARKSTHGVDDLSMDDQEDEGGVLLDSKADETPQGNSPNQYLDGEDALPYDEVATEEKEMTTKGRLNREKKLNLVKLTHLNEQKSTMPFGMRSCMEFTINEPPIRAILISVLIFQFLNLLSFPILFCHTYLSGHRPRQHCYISRKPVGRMRRSLSKL